MSLSKFARSDSSSGSEDLEWLRKMRTTKRKLRFRAFYDGDSSSDDNSAAPKPAPKPGPKRLQVVIMLRPLNNV